MTPPTPITHENTHGHAALLYQTPEERVQLLAEYFREGIGNNELCVLVTPDLPTTVITKFKKAGLDIYEPVQSGMLRIFSMDDTYMPGGKFAADYMLANVATFIQEAKSLGYSGLRTAGEMSWIYKHPEFTQEASSYEERVNGLSREHPEFIGICLYPIQEHFSKVLHDISDTHPSFIYNGQPSLNPYYNLS